jgi:hypothetical protein
VKRRVSRLRFDRAGADRADGDQRKRCDVSREASKKSMRGRVGYPLPPGVFSEVLILLDFKSFAPEVLVLKGLKCDFSEVLILEGLRAKNG